MHLQENTLFDLDLQVKVTLNVAQCPLHHVTYAPTEFEVTTLIALGGEAFTRNSIFDLDLGVKVTQNVAQYPLHHVNHPATKFEVARSNRLGGDTFTRKFNIWPLTLTLGSRSHKICPVPSTSCDLFSYKVWSCYIKRLRRRCIYKKIQYLTFDLDLGVKVTLNVTQHLLHHVTYSATNFEVAMSNRLGGDTFTIKYNIWPWPWGQGHTICCPVPSTSCDLFNYKV